MLDNRQLKIQGLRFGRTLQMAVRTAVMFKADHRNCDGPIGLSYAALNGLLKEVGQFTIGFIDKELMLNKLLTTDAGLAQLESDFLKRGFGAVSFDPGVTLARFKRLIALLVTPLQTVEEAGGAREFIYQNPIEGIRIFPALADQKRTASGDRVIESDSAESYLEAKQFGELSRNEFTDSLDMLLESAGFDTTARMAYLSAMKGTGPTAGGPVAGGAPDTAADGAAAGAPNRGLEGSGSGPGMGGFGNAGVAGGPPSIAGGTIGFAAAPAVGKPSSNQEQKAGVNAAIAAGLNASIVEAASRFDGAAPAASLPDLSAIASVRNVSDVIRVSVERALVDVEGDPSRSHIALARLLRDVRADAVISHFPMERQEELRGLPPDQLARELVEDTAVKWMSRKLIEPHGDRVIIEEEVLHVLARTLRATQAADRMARKVMQLFGEHAVSKEMMLRVQEELLWVKLPAKQKHAQLLSIQHFDDVQFRRLMEYVRELLKQEKIAEASEITVHYFAALDLFRDAEGHGLKRASELIRVMSVARADFVPRTVETLGAALLRDEIAFLVHCQIADCLRVLSRCIAAYEDFEQVRSIGTWLEKSMHRGKAQHSHCCEAAIEELLPPAAVERIIEMCYAKLDDSGWMKLAANLLRFNYTALDMVFERLAIEQEASRRLGLMRVIKLTGHAGIHVARKHLKDTRWYVVRNSCLVLSETPSRETLEDLRSLLRHDDQRVQKAAFAAVSRSRLAERSVVLASGLPDLPPDLAEEALRELSFLKDPATVPALERFLHSVRHSAITRAAHVLEVLAAVPDDRAATVLLNVLSDADPDNHLRRAALHALAKSKAPSAKNMIIDFAGAGPPDELREEGRGLWARSVGVAGNNQFLRPTEGKEPGASK